MAVKICEQGYKASTDDGLALSSCVSLYVCTVFGLMCMFRKLFYVIYCDC